MYVVCEPGAPETDTLEREGHCKGGGQKKEENTDHTKQRQKKETIITFFVFVL